MHPVVLGQSTAVGQSGSSKHASQSVAHSRQAQSRVAAQLGMSSGNVSLYRSVHSCTIASAAGAPPHSPPQRNAPQSLNESRIATVTLPSGSSARHAVSHSAVTHRDRQRRRVRHWGSESQALFSNTQWVCKQVVHAGPPSNPGVGASIAASRGLESPLSDVQPPSANAAVTSDATNRCIPTAR